MEDDRHASEESQDSGTPEAGKGRDQANAFLKQLIAFPGSQSVGPLSLVPGLMRGSVAQSDPVSSVAATAGEPVTSIVEQAASVLDEEMAKGVLAARGGARQTPGGSDATLPAVRQMHEIVDTLATLLPGLQGRPGGGAAGHGVATGGSAGGEAEPLARVSPPTSVKPGDHATITMMLRNSESRPVRLVPVATDLLGSHGGRIPNARIEISPSEVALEPQDQTQLTLSVAIPGEAPAGRYSGLLVVTGLDYLIALITMEVADPEAGSGGPQTQTSVPDGKPTGGTGSAAGSVTSPNAGHATANLHALKGGAGHAAGPRQEANQTSAVSTGRMMQEAIRLTEDGELGNSDAIRLLDGPHRPDEVKAVLSRFDRALTREARSKLVLEAFAPLPEGVDNQRYEPIFDRYPISGRTYTTESGTVVLNELRYYNGEIVQLFGECPHVAQVQEDLAGSGYRPLVVRQSDGRESAIAQLWAQQFSDTSILPYDAAFLIVAAVPDDAPADRAWLAAHENGATSVLSVLDGGFDAANAVYENRTRLFLVRLLDSTRIAIEVGRERMGTDKRPGTVELERDGRRRSFSVKDGAGNPVATIDFVVADDPDACLPELAAAAETAGIALRALPEGTEYVFPCAARIGDGPVVHWQWRTDQLPRVQHVEPDTATLDSRSEEGEILLRWGFEPRRLGYIPNVRGAVTGLM